MTIEGVAIFQTILLCLAVWKIDKQMKRIKELEENE